MKKPSITFQTLLFTFVRVIINTFFRMIYPFQSHFASGLGVELSQITKAVSIRSLGGIFGPFFASIADQKGRKLGMLFGLSLFITGAIFLLLMPNYLGFTLALIFGMLGKYTFDPSTQAYLSDQIPYERRSRYLAITEMGWSLAFFLGVPVVGFLLATGNWTSPFPVFLGLGLFAFLLIQRLIPKETQEKKTPTKSPFTNIWIALSNPSALAGLSVTLMLSAGNEITNLFFGPWLEDSFNLRITALGMVALVIGISEFIGEGFVSTITDRLGKQRAIRYGLALNCLAVLLLPLSQTSLISALIALFFVYLTFEYTFVSAIPMMTEIMPKYRATLMALNIASASVGRFLGAGAITLLIDQGLWLKMASTVVFNLLALVALRFVVIESGELNK